ncbi:MAG: hypothetical protein WCQ60_01380 [bacterium]
MTTTQRTTMWRVYAAVGMLVLILWGYWWIACAAAIACVFFFASYYEVLIWGIIFDALYAPPSQGVVDYHAHIAFLFVIILFFVGIFLKKRLAFYS